MDWDKVELHIENLIPGLAIGGLLASALPNSPQTDRALGLAGGAFFVAASYLLGTIGNLLARLLLDTVSRHSLRPVAIILLTRDKLKPGERRFKDMAARYSRALDAGLTCGKPIIETEVAKRRTTGRLLRSCLLPGWTAIWLVGSYRSWTGWGFAVAFVVTYLALLVLYSYAEVVVFREGLRGERVRAA